MRISSFLAIAASGLVLAGTAQAETVSRPAPGQGGSITLGDVAGSGYYTPAENGFHVVITLTKDENRPVRFEAVLTEGQSITLSAPDKLGGKSETIEITREGDAIVVTQAP